MPIHETGINLVKAKLSYRDYPGQLPLVLTRNKSVTLFFSQKLLITRVVVQRHCQS